MSQHYSLLNLCRKKSAIQKEFDPASPLDTVDGVGLNSMGCRPVVAHRRVVADGTIVSRIRQDRGTYEGSFLTTIDDDGISGIPPAAELDLTASATVAALTGQAPLTGSTTSPFPSSWPHPSVLWEVGGAPYTKTVQGLSFDLSSDATAWDRFAALSMIGFGGTNGGGSGASSLIVLPPDDHEYVGGSLSWRPYHRYLPTVTLPYLPSRQPLTMTYNTTFGYYLERSSAFSISFGAFSTELEGHGYPCSPCLVNATSSQLVGPTLSEPNGPSLNRKYHIYRMGSVTVNGYNATASHTFDVPKGDMRGFLTVYVDSSFILDLSVAEGALMGTTGVSLPTVGNGPAPFNGLFSGTTFDTAYEFSILGTEATYTFTATTPAGVRVSSPATLYDTGKGSHQRCFEAWIGAV